MAHAALKELDEALWVHAAEASEAAAADLQKLNESAPVEVTTNEKVFGFTVTSRAMVPDPQLAEKKDGLESRRARHAAFRSACRAARERAESGGLEPVAVLPSRAWDALCAAAGLYRFEHLGPTGTVTVRNPYPGHATVGLFMLVCVVVALTICGPGRPYYLVAVLGAVALFPLVVGWADSVRGDDRYWAVFCAGGVPAGLSLASRLTPPPLLLQSCFAIALCIVVGIVVSAFLLVGCAMLVERYAAQLTGALLAALPSRLACRVFWPSRRDETPEETSDVSSRAVLHVSFPDPPADVQQVLTRVRDCYGRLCVAAVPGAITLGLAEILAPNPLAKDPIVYVREGELVVVLAQFGDFPLEAETVHRISRLDFLP